VGRRVTVLLDARPLDAFLQGHAPGAAHLPADAWDARAAELPPRDADILLVAPDGEAAAERLRARGFRHVEAAHSADRSETGPAHAVAWRPAAALERIAARLPRTGRALDLACGSGRDVAFLAARGLSTLGLDVLPDALARARLLLDACAGLAEGAALRPRAPVLLARADATRPLPVRNETLAFACGFRYLDRPLFARLAPLLRPGGMLAWETFSVRAHPDAHPRRAAFRLEPGELVRLCEGAGLAVEEAWEDGDRDGVLARKSPS
jgi:SAM-dependent methyltransferase